MFSCDLSAICQQTVSKLSANCQRFVSKNFNKCLSTKTNPSKKSKNGCKRKTLLFEKSILNFMEQLDSRCYDNEETEDSSDNRQKRWIKITIVIAFFIRERFLFLVRWFR